MEQQQQLQFEEAEKIMSWREMHTGVYIFVDKEMQGVNKWMKPITVVTLKQQVGGPSTKYYAPPSLHYGLESQPNTKYIKYEGVAVSKTGYQFPVFKYASGV